MTRFAAALSLVLLASVWAGWAAASDGVRPAAAARPDAAGPLSDGTDCVFFRWQALDKGLRDPATEMLWACQAILSRRAAGFKVGDRLGAAEFALDAYRAAVAAAERERGAAAARIGFAHRPQLQEAELRRLAEESGAALAIEALRDGY
jgi:hypothetical protein